jgi:hypothetical protein
VVAARADRRQEAEPDGTRGDCGGGGNVVRHRANR